MSRHLRPPTQNSRRPGLAGWSAVAAAVLVASAGCGGGGGGGGGGGDDGRDGGTVEVQPDPGCTTAQPTSVELSGWYAEFARVCRSQLGLSLRVENISPGVVRVFAVVGAPAWQVEPAEEDSLAAAAARTWLPATATSPDERLLAPGDSAVATSLTEASIDAEVVGELSVAVYSTSVVAGWLEEKVPRPAHEQWAEQVASCAQDAGKVYAAGQAATWQDATAAAFEAYPSCRSLYRAVVDAAGEQPKPPPEVADELAEITQHLKTSVWDDAIRAAGRAFRVFHG